MFWPGTSKSAAAERNWSKSVARSSSNTESMVVPGVSAVHFSAIA
jgi:hypothetical protein